VLRRQRLLLLRQICRAPRTLLRCWALSDPGLLVALAGVAGAVRPKELLCWQTSPGQLLHGRCAQDPLGSGFWTCIVCCQAHTINE
jgi:hypothetical protein